MVDSIEAMPFSIFNVGIVNINVAFNNNQIAIRQSNEMMAIK